MLPSKEAAMKTGTNLSARQQALKARHKLSNRQFQQMLEMLADLTPAERASLEEPDFITEDEADIIVSNRRINEPTVSLDEVLAESGVPRRKRIA
jgi:hypothetical protein